jgi:hypothetical protein
MSGAPKPEAENSPDFEITAEMEAAGAAFICDHFPEESGGSFSDIDRFMAREFFLTMLRATSKSSG